MFLFRLLLFVFLGFMIRRLWLSLRRASPARPSGRRPAGPSAADRQHPPGASPRQDSGSTITDQEIDDADFEEIP